MKYVEDMEVIRRKKQPSFAFNWKHTLAIWLSVIAFTMFMGHSSKTVAMQSCDKDKEILAQESKAVIADVKAANEQEGKQ